MNLICAGITVFFFLLTPFVWTVSECDALSVVPLSESVTLSTLPLGTSHEVMSILILEGIPGTMKGCG